jgi:hypothetical protein
MARSGLWDSEVNVNRIVDEMRRLLRERGRTDVTVEMMGYDHSPGQWGVAFDCDNEDDDVIDEVFDEALATVMGPSLEEDEGQDEEVDCE